VTSTLLDKSARAKRINWSISYVETSREPYRVSLVGGEWHLNEWWDAPSQEKAIEKALASIEAWRTAAGRGDVREKLQPRFKGAA
jgi:hypothetical protein